MDHQTIPLDAARHLLAGLTVVGARDRAERIATSLRLWPDAAPLAEIANTVGDRPLTADELRADITRIVGEQRAAELIAPCADRMTAIEVIDKRSTAVRRARARDRAVAICRDVVEGRTDDDAPDAFLQKQVAELSSSIGRRRSSFRNLVGAGMAHRVAMHAGKSGFKLHDKFFDSDLAGWITKWVSPCGTMLPGGLCIMVGAASGGGKTTFSGGLLLSAAMAGMPVLMYQAELDHGDHAADLATQCAGLDRGSIPNDRVVSAVDSTAERLDGLVSYPTTDKKSLLETPAHLRHEVEAWLADLPPRTDGNDCPGLVVVDYLQCLRDPESRSDWDGVDKIAQELADIAHKTRLIVVVLSQMTRGSQLAFATAVAAASTAEDHQSFADLMDAAVESFGTNGMAGGDGVKRRADVAFVIGGVHGQRIAAIAKERGNAWSEQEAKTHKTKLVDLRRNGRWESSESSMAEFVATLPKPKPKPKGGGGGGGRGGRNRGLTDAEKTAKAEKEKQGFAELNARLSATTGKPAASPAITAPAASATVAKKRRPL